MKKKVKVFVAFSGGVDSTVAAHLLKKEGYDVTAVYMKNWSGESLGIDDNCPWEEDLEFVEKVSNQLSIPFKTYNFEREYRELVINNFYEEYALGNTPNPDLLCNKFIKFDAFLNKAISEGADMIATGHYAISNEGRLFKGKDRNKDQSYFLAGLSSFQLSHTLFPIGNLDKDEVRKIAKRNNFANAQRKDSQGICFVGKVDLREFISLKLKPKKGDIIDIDSGHKVGEHDGIWFYTEGQRKGLKIGGLDQPYFVVRKDPSNNQLLVAQGKSNPSLWNKVIKVSNFHFINSDEIVEEFSNFDAMIRYRGTATKLLGQEQDKEGNIDLIFSEPQWAPAPGQSVVFYDYNECLGLAKIV